jgi:hypothetical protein
MIGKSASTIFMQTPITIVVSFRRCCRTSTGRYRIVDAFGSKHAAFSWTGPVGCAEQSHRSRSQVSSDWIEERGDFHRGPTCPKLKNRDLIALKVLPNATSYGIYAEMSRQVDTNQK